MSQRMGKYWICDVCIIFNDLSCFKTVNTRAMGKCSWCNSDKESFLTPLRDLKNSEGKRADSVKLQGYREDSINTTQEGT